MHCFKSLNSDNIFKRIFAQFYKTKKLTLYRIFVIKYFSNHFTVLGTGYWNTWVQETSTNVMFQFCKGPSIKDVRKFLPIFSPPFPLVRMCPNFQTPLPPDVRIFFENSTSQHKDHFREFLKIYCYWPNHL